MDVSTVRQKKNDLQNDIRALLVKFSEETGFEVTNIFIDDTMKVGTFSEKTAYIYNYIVKAEIRLWKGH